MSEDHIRILKPDPQNARKHNPRNIGMIVDSLHETGFGRSILIDEDNQIIAGNGTVDAAGEAGIERLRIIEADGNEVIAVRRRGLTPEQKKRLALFDNRAAELAEWDVEQLAREMEAGTNLDGLFTDDELTALLESIQVEPPVLNGDPDDVPELPAEPITKPGDVILLGKHRLMCGDSTVLTDVERLLDGATAPTVVFDPPFDADAAILNTRWPCDDVLVFTDHRHTLDTIDGWPPFKCLFAWDGISSWHTPGWPLARGKFALWFGRSPYDADGSHYGEPGVSRQVQNTRGSYEYHADPRGKHLSTVFSSPATRQFTGHAHAKPVDWVRLLVANCTRGAVLDLFAGSGTTVVACEQLDRMTYAMELDPKYCDVIVTRWQNLTGKMAVRPSAVGIA